MAGITTQRVLVLNPNSSKEMTEGMAKAIEGMKLDQSIEIATYTAPVQAPASINNDEDIKASTDAVISALETGAADFNAYDSILVACYSVHPLVQKLSQQFPCSVTGIFEASILTAQLLLKHHSAEKWGIVTTGTFWEDHLTAGVKSFLGQDAGSSTKTFAGVFTTGLNAGDFHQVAEEEVTARLRKATQKLLEAGNVKCVVMGCAGMAGLERIIRSTAAEVQGAEAGRALYVVDGVKAGVLQLEQMMQSKRLFS